MTLASVMLLIVALVGVGLLAIRATTQDLRHTGQMIARERALLAAQSAAELATLRLRQRLSTATVTGFTLNTVLQGQAPQGSCADPCSDCIPGVGGGAPRVGLRTPTLSTELNACYGHSCMRQGALLWENDASLSTVKWCDVPLASLLPGSDPEATVRVWVRNNLADGLRDSDPNVGWLTDNDNRIVVTATGIVRGTQVTVEQEFAMGAPPPASTLKPMSPDEGYGGGHNNDGSSVKVCSYAKGQV